jgi:SagB-type dehydrogenase family enzyme
MNNTRYYVLNEALEPCPVWVPGQLHIAGAGVARGYWRDEAKTRERFITCPRTGERIYRSGDMGRYLPDGNIEFLGREDLQVKIRGCRIELGEIESTLQQHPALAAAVVTATGEARELARLVAYVVPRRANDVKKPTGFKQEHLNGVAVLDAVDRVEFKLNQWGIRRDTDRGAIALPDAGPHETPNGHATRRSVREFSTDPLPLPAFGELMRSLVQIEMDGLPKYRYPSGGGLYPVQTYVYVKPDRVEDLPAGVYYHDPKDNRLVLMSPGALLDAGTQLPHNRAIFDSSAFVIFLIGQFAAVEPLYGGLARDFCLLEAGYMSQLLMSVAPEHQIGLCPIGAMEFDPVRPHFRLDDSHVLVHLLYGGLAGEKPPPSPPSHAGSNGLVGELRGFLSKKLPPQLQPSAYVVLESLPLTPNGKVDRTRLPAPDAVPAPAPQADAPPRNDIERTLMAIAREILQIEQVGIHQNFFDLGGTSIHMVRILNRVRSEFGRDVPITEIFRHPSISSLAGYLSEQEGGGPALDQSDQRASQRKASRARRHASHREQSGSGQEGGGPR